MEVSDKLKLEDPAVIVIMGATGDLAQSKLYVALLDLFTKGFLPDQFRVIGFALDKLDDRSFRKLVKKAIKRHDKKTSRSQINSFLKTLHYQTGLFQDIEGFKELSDRIATIRKDECQNRLNTFFYLAVPPKFYDDIFENLKKTKLNQTAEDTQGVTRVMIEKPFGHDLISARRLDKKLTELFTEQQIYRIDHFLAKETVQNILSFRFSNTLFENIWNYETVDRIEIKLREKKGVEGREKFYDEVGAFRDVGQNHILQLLALTTMEYPGKIDPEKVREERAEVIESLVPIEGEDIARQTVQGQYEGYSNQEGVKKNSNTETFFRIKSFLNSKRWQGVPIYLESGKKMFETKTKITIYFKKSPCLCPPEFEKPHQNRVVFRIQPDEGISVVFWAKKPGFSGELEEKKLSFYYSDKSNFHLFASAYEKVLYDCFRGDQTLFASTREVEASWKFMTPVIKNWATKKPYLYKAGSYGPKERLKI
ncbi:glucose-6-phosphate dehydrogenase [Patescibacteria group bacterium]|nr:glucose-6-phosphate dehydrogenase [Patescibacteria group bacterium]